MYQEAPGESESHPMSRQEREREKGPGDQRRWEVLNVCLLLQKVCVDSIECGIDVLLEQLVDVSLMHGTWSQNTIFLCFSRSILPSARRDADPEGEGSSWSLTR